MERAKAVRSTSRRPRASVAVLPQEEPRVSFSSCAARSAPIREASAVQLFARHHQTLNRCLGPSPQHMAFHDALVEAHTHRRRRGETEDAAPWPDKSALRRA